MCGDIFCDISPVKHYLFRFSLFGYIFPVGISCSHLQYPCVNCVIFVENDVHNNDWILFKSQKKASSNHTRPIYSHMSFYNLGVRISFRALQLVVNASYMNKCVSCWEFDLPEVFQCALKAQFVGEYPWSPDHITWTQYTLNDSILFLFIRCITQFLHIFLTSPPLITIRNNHHLD